MNPIISESAGPKEVGKLFNVSRESLEKLEIYAALLKKWQRSINLVGPLEVPRLWSRHIADGLQINEKISVAEKCVVDIGSGAGIPGLILAVVSSNQDLHVHLVESNGKKAAFLREAVRVLGVSADVHCARVETLYGESWIKEVDIVVARALAPLAKLMELATPLVHNQGKMLFLKGLDVDSELTKTTKCWNMNYVKYPSRTHRGGCILEVKEFQRDPNSTGFSQRK